MTTISNIIARIVNEAAEVLEDERCNASSDFLYEIETNTYFNHRAELIKNGNHYKCSNCGRDQYIVDLPLPNYCSECGFEFLNSVYLNF